jgi:hypothetical protein
MAHYTTADTFHFSSLKVGDTFDMFDPGTAEQDVRTVVFVQEAVKMANVAGEYVEPIVIVSAYGRAGLYYQRMCSGDWEGCEPTAGEIATAIAMSLMLSEQAHHADRS